jgi:hypothetical protein
MRKFRIKKNAYIDDMFGLEVGGIYEANEVCASDGTVSLKVDSEAEYWWVALDDVEEVFEATKHPTYSTVNVGGVGLTVELNSEINANTQVNPQHYKNGNVECIEAIKSAVVGKDGFSGYLVGNVIKYLWRFESKGGVTDLEKSNWYLLKLIDYEKNKER